MWADKSIAVTLVGCAVVLTGAIVETPAEVGPASDNGRGHEITIVAQPFSLDPLDASRRKFGKLEWRGGLILQSDDKNFGGFSGLEINRAGGRVLAVSDQGYWLRASLDYKGSSIAGLGSAQMGALLRLNGKPLRSKKTQDAESIVLKSGDIDQGMALISFERLHRIGLFPVGKRGIGAPKRYLKLPNGIRNVTRNKGLEAIGLFRSGPLKNTIIAFPEKYRDKTAGKDGQARLIGWLIKGRRSQALKINRRGKYNITDLAVLPNGDVLILERYVKRPTDLFSLLTATIKIRLRRFRAAKIRPGAVLNGEILFEGDRRLLKIDNMEGMAVHKGRQGETVITLISDDNFNPIQQTLLMQFTLPGERKKSANKNLQSAGPAR